MDYSTDDNDSMYVDNNGSTPNHFRALPPQKNELCIVDDNHNVTMTTKDKAAIFAHNNINSINSFILLLCVPHSSHGKFT